MSTIFTRELVVERLKLWLDAEAAVATGQSYSIGSRSLTRANLDQIQKQINYWRKELDAIEGRSKRRVRTIVPRDL